MTTDVLDQNGLTTESLTQIVADLTTGMQNIYGSGINVASNSPDGQMINLVAQQCIDNRELATLVYNSFNPDYAVGSVLDQRCAINNVIREAGTFTVQPIDLTITQTVTLQGLDGNYNSINGTGYTVQDNAGNQFILADTVTLTPGVNTGINFRAAQLGAIQTTVNTITSPVTIVAGVSVINNSSSALSVGQNEETDAQLRIRRSKSVALATTGYLNGLLGQILALTGVVSAVLFENVFSTTDANGIPGHGIWLIVEGGANSDIGNAIYASKSYGANMKGSTSYAITTPSGGTFTALFDRPTSVPLYIQFNIQKTTATTFDTVNIPIYMQNALAYAIDEAADTVDIYAVALAAINATGGGGVPTNVKISLDNATWVDYLKTPTLNDQFTVAAANISITILP